MATTPIVMFRGALPTASTTLYTAPGSVTPAMLTSLVLANTSTLQRTATIRVGTYDLVSAVLMEPNTMVVLDLKVVLNTLGLTGLSNGTGVVAHICGVVS